MIAVPSGEVRVLLGELSHLHVNPCQGRRQNYLLLGRSQAPLVRGNTEAVRTKDRALIGGAGSALGESSASHEGRCAYYFAFI